MSEQNPPPYGQPAQHGPQHGPQHGQPPYPQAPYGQSATPYGTAGSPYAHARDPEERPGRLLAAAIITWVFAGLMLLAAVAILVTGIAGNAAFFDQVVEQSGEGSAVARDELRAGIIVIGLVIGFWSAAAIVLAFLLLRRQNWARITLAVSAVATALFSLLAIGSGVSVLTLGAAIVVLVLIFGRDSNDWFARRDAAGPYGGQYGGPYAGGYGAAYPTYGSPYAAPPPPPATGHPQQPWPGQSAAGERPSGPSYPSGAPDRSDDPPSASPDPDRPDPSGQPPRPPSGGW